VQIIKGLRLRPKSVLLEGRSLPDRAIRSFWIGGRTNHRDNLGLRDGQHRNFGSVNDLERYATREPLGHCTVAPSPQHDDIDSAGVRDADYLRRSATDGDDRFKLFTPPFCRALRFAASTTSRPKPSKIPSMVRTPRLSLRKSSSSRPT